LAPVLPDEPVLSIALVKEQSENGGEFICMHRMQSISQNPQVQPNERDILSHILEHAQRGAVPLHLVFTVLRHEAARIGAFTHPDGARLHYVPLPNWQWLEMTDAGSGGMEMNQALARAEVLAILGHTTEVVDACKGSFPMYTTLSPVHEGDDGATRSHMSNEDSTRSLAIPVRAFLPGPLPYEASWSVGPNTLFLGYCDEHNAPLRRSTLYRLAASLWAEHSWNANLDEWAGPVQNVGISYSDGAKSPGMQGRVWADLPSHRPGAPQRRDPSQLLGHNPPPAGTAMVYVMLSRTLWGPRDPRRASLWSIVPHSVQWGLEHASTYWDSLTRQQPPHFTRQTQDPEFQGIWSSKEIPPSFLVHTGTASALTRGSSSEDESQDAEPTIRMYLTDGAHLVHAKLTIAAPLAARRPPVSARTSHATQQPVRASRRHSQQATPLLLTPATRSQTTASTVSAGASAEWEAPGNEHSRTHPLDAMTGGGLSTSASTRQFILEMTSAGDDGLSPRLPPFDFHAAGKGTIPRAMVMAFMQKVQAATAEVPNAQWIPKMAQQLLRNHVLADKTSASVAAAAGQLMELGAVPVVFTGRADGKGCPFTLFCELLHDYLCEHPALMPQFKAIITKAIPTEQSRW
jgi:hypothetical protein